jgi:hypothetical protein
MLNRGTLVNPGSAMKEQATADADRAAVNDPGRLAAFNRPFSFSLER